MSPTALALVLVAALLHATWNLAAKGVTTDRVTFVWLYIGVSTAIWLPIGVVWVVVAGDRPAWPWFWAGLVSAALHVVYQLVLQRGYAEGELNLVYPLARGTGPLLTFVIAATALAQRPDLAESLGVLAVVGGVLLISFGGPTGPDHRRAGVGYGLATGATIAAYTLWDNHAVNGLGVPVLPYFVVNTVLQLPLLLPLLPSRATRPPLADVWRAARAAVLTVALFSPLAYVLVLRAMQLAPVALVAAGREASIVVGAGFGWLVLREPRPVRRLAGAAVVLAGIGLLALG